MNKHLSSLDGLKGLSACIIAFAWHYQHFAPTFSPFKIIIPFSFDYGYLMVELFFMLSGFGMMIGYKNRILDNNLSFKDFILRRISKIYPAFLFSTILVIVLEVLYLHKTGTTFVYPNFDIYHLLLNIFLLQNGLLETAWSFNSPSWCISICFVCYLIFYYVIKNSNRESHIYYKFFVLAICSLAIIISNINYPIFNSLIGRGLSCFSIGVLLYGLYERKNSFNYKMIGYISLISIIIMYLAYRLNPNYNAIVGNLRLAFIIGIAPMIIIAAIEVPIVNSILSSKPIVYLGKISMSIYLFHFPTQCLIEDIDKYFNMNIDYSRHIVWISYVICVLIVASIYNLYINKWFSGLLKRVFIK